jgi:hypothetical protein
MGSLDKVLGWFPHTPTEWIEFILVAVLLWLLMVLAISELDLNWVIPILDNNLDGNEFADPSKTLSLSYRSKWLSALDHAAIPPALLRVR